MRGVAVALFDGVVPFDLATPCEVFGRVRLADGRDPYRVRVYGAKKTVEAGELQLRTKWGLDELARAHTVIVPGVADLTLPLSRELLTSLRAAAAKGARIASICTGAFILGAAGLLCRHCGGRTSVPPLGA